MHAFILIGGAYVDLEMGNLFPVKVCSSVHISKEEQSIINAVKEKETQFNNTVHQEAEYTVY